MSLFQVLVRFALVAVVIAVPVAAAAQGPQVPASVEQPLSESAQQIVEGVPDENTPPPGEHYYRSNEWRQDLLIAPLEGRGGALIGVGADQNYTMAAMARSQLIFAVDYDPMIPWVHAVYGALVRNSETPADLLARFDEDNERATLALLRSELSSHPRSRQIVAMWQRRRDTWGAYLRRVQGLVRDGVPFSWLADPEMYQYVRKLFRNGRVIARNGDVTADRTMRGVAEACRRLGVPARVVYFSNAEQFFPYSDSFVENMRQLPTDERTIVVRTIRHRDIEIAEDGRWHYMVHDFADFLSRLETGAYRRSFAFTADLISAGAPHLGNAGISTMTADTPRAILDRARRARRRQ